LRPIDFDFLGGFPAPAEGVPDEILKFIDVGADAKFQSEDLLLLYWLLEEKSPFPDD